MADDLGHWPATDRPPLLPTVEALTGLELGVVAEHGGAFGWLADEPDLYDLGDGEPV